MNQHTVLQKDKTTTGCASIIDLFFKRLFFPRLTILRGSKKRTGAKFWPDDEELFGIKEKTVQVKHCILDFYCTVLYHRMACILQSVAFYQEKQPLLPTKGVTLSVYDNENTCGESDARVNRFYEICPWQFAHLVSFYTQISFSFLTFLFVILFLLLKAKIS